MPDGLVLTTAVPPTDTQRSVFLLMMALSIVFVLIVSVIWLGITLRRNRRRRLKDNLHIDEPTDHSNAWAEAGRRLRVDEPPAPREPAP